MAAVSGGCGGGGGDGGGDDGGGNGGCRLARCNQTADSLLCAAGLPISGKGRTYGTASSTVVRARVLRGGGRRGGAPLGGAPEQERPASGSGGSLVTLASYDASRVSNVVDADFISNKDLTFEHN